MIQFSSSFQASKGDFVLIEYASKKSATAVEYVGEVCEVLSRKMYSVSFLKQYMNRRHEFCFPHVIQVEEVSDDYIIAVLPKPTIQRRGIHVFPYDIL